MQHRWDNGTPCKISLTKSKHNKRKLLRIPLMVTSSELFHQRRRSHAHPNNNPTIKNFRRGGNSHQPRVIGQIKQIISHKRKIFRFSRANNHELSSLTRIRI